MFEELFENKGPIFSFHLSSPILRNNLLQVISWEIKVGLLWTDPFQETQGVSNHYLGYLSIAIKFIIIYLAINKV